MVRLATSFLFGASVVFLLAGYQKEAYNLGVKDMAEICKSATDKLAELEKNDRP